MAPIRESFIVESDRAQTRNLQEEKSYVLGCIQYILEVHDKEFLIKKP